MSLKKDKHSLEMSRYKCIIIGDGNSGKSSLIMTYKEGEYPEVYVPTVFEAYVQNITLEDNQQVELTLYDTAGQKDLDQIRSISYCNADVVMLCFSVDNSVSYDNIQNFWLLEMAKFCPKMVPIVLVGCKLDVRNAYMESLNNNSNPKSKSIYKNMKLSFTKSGSSHELGSFVTTKEGVLFVCHYKT